MCQQTETNYRIITWCHNHLLASVFNLLPLRFNMIKQQTSLFWANVTFIWISLYWLGIWRKRVHSDRTMLFHMSHKSLWSAETLSTLSTVIRLLSSMNSLLCFHVCRLSETRVTVWALVRFFSPAWILWCCFSWLAAVKLFSHSKHMRSLTS